MKKNLIIIIVVLALCVVAVVATHFIRAQIKAANQIGQQQQQQTEQEQQVRDVVTNFGKQLQKVSLAAPKDIAAKEIEDSYGPFVSADILNGWKANPSNAPGRLTSSPWPDRIEIQHLEKAADGSYDVGGMIVEVTSVELANGGMASEYQVFLKLRQQNGKWIITGYEAIEPISQ